MPRKVFHMKNRLVLFIVSVLLLMEMACNRQAKQAREYHDTVMQATQVVIDSSLDFTDAVQRYKKEDAIQSLKNYSDLVERALSSVQQKGKFKEDTTLQFFAKEMLLFYKGSLKTGFQPFLNAVNSNSFTNQEAATADSLITDFTMNENLYWERFNWAEKKFYQEHDLSKTEK